ncbi:hypothetical protein XU18_4159 [Perkinsela sp. CCAP 1560/4]|nr:hypothetical protein XU18_4159 [Perkinsela sp. CCAP 1560/4]|eukprot:KNH04671.1 hypothetical protein XU18_4159 [Perkinsela sp. CCAP 1560/4]
MSPQTLRPIFSVIFPFSSFRHSSERPVKKVEQHYRLNNRLVSLSSQDSAENIQMLAKAFVGLPQKAVLQGPSDKVLQKANKEGADSK